MTRCLVVALLASMMCVQATARQFHREVTGIPLTVRGRAIDLPFAGGLNSPVYRFVDIDNDGDPDLIAFDNDLCTDFYRNTGSRQVPHFELQTGAVEMPSIRIWLTTADLDGDGLQDVITDTAGTFMLFHRNIGSAGVPVFQMTGTVLKDSGGVPLNAGSNSIPAFVDIDADRDLDLFSTNAADGSFNFYRNTGSPSGAEFVFVTSRFDGITVIGDSCYGTPTGAAGSASSPLHGSGAITFADVDGNGTMDLYLGDLFSQIVFELRNIGTPSAPSLTCSSNPFPPESEIHSSGFNYCQFVDIDSDADSDMFVSVLAGIVQRNGFWFLENTGTPGGHHFVLRSREYLSMLDVGLAAHPACADIDADDDADILIGTGDGTIWFLRNDGTPGNPQFACDDTMFAGVSGGYSAAPATGDIDADGDMDLIVGGFDGHIAFYRNIGTPRLPDFRNEIFGTDSLSVQQYASPALADIDDDGDLDLCIGAANGTIAFYRNTGDSLRCHFVSEAMMFTTIDVGERATPALADIDGDGDYDLLVGARNGGCRLYRNAGTPSQPEFSMQAEPFGRTQPHAEGAPAVVDIDADGDYDLFVGTSKGGMHFYRSDGPEAVDISWPGEYLLRGTVNYPNPFNPVTNIQFTMLKGDFIRIRVFDIFGNEVGGIPREWFGAGIHEVAFNAEGLASGMYMYRIESTTGSQSGRMVFIK